MKKIYYGLMLAGALTLCTGCSSSLLDIDNPNEVTNDTYWNKPEDATAGVNACYSFLYKEGTWMRWLSFRYDLTSDKDGVLLLGLNWATGHVSFTTTIIFMKATTYIGSISM